MAVEYVYLDTETTGLYPDSGDEVLQIGILDDDNQVLLDSLVKPVKNKKWRKAQDIHGITPSDVKNAPTLEQLRPQIIEAVKGRIVVIYNSDFDSAFLRDELKHAEVIEDCMNPFAEIYGEWHDYFQSYTWQKLETAAKYVYHEWDGQSHNAINDCMATRSVWHYINDPLIREVVDSLHQDEADAHEVEQQLYWDDFWKKRKDEKRIDRLSQFWMRWLKFPLYVHGRRDGTQTIWNWMDSEDQDMYVTLFTGYSPDAWRTIQGYEHLPKFHKLNQIPDEYRTLGNLENVRTWMNLKPDAIYESTTKRTVRKLYRQEQVEEILRENLHKYSSPDEVPNHLMTKTAMKREGIPKNIIAALHPVGTCWYSRFRLWADLYDMNRAQELIELSEWANRTIEHDEQRRLLAERGVCISQDVTEQLEQ